MSRSAYRQRSRQRVERRRYRHWRWIAARPKAVQPRNNQAAGPYSRPTGRLPGEGPRPLWPDRRHLPSVERGARGHHGPRGGPGRSSCLDQIHRPNLTDRGRLPVCTATQAIGSAAHPQRLACRAWAMAQDCPGLGKRESRAVLFQLAAGARSTVMASIQRRPQAIGGNAVVSTSSPPVRGRRRSSKHCCGPAASNRDRSPSGCHPRSHRSSYGVATTKGLCPRLRGRGFAPSSE